MTVNEFHQEIARSILPLESSEEDVLLYMALIHTHCIRVKPEIEFQDVTTRQRDQPVVLAALTQRHVASIAASLYPHESNRGKYEYWYSLYNSLTPYEVPEDIPSHHLHRVQMFRGLLLCDPRIDAVEED